MGSSAFNRDDYDARSSYRAVDPKGTFAYDHDIKTGAAKAEVHPTLSPKGLKIRESRDSDAHPVTVPIGITLDTTGSMSDVPKMIQAALPKLMGAFLDDKASGKRYLGDGYPAILISAIDDYDAQRSGAYYKAQPHGEGCLQVGQFESGIEIDDNLTNLWFTENGGGTYHEDYELALYVASRHTAHDHWDKRGRKGYWFIIGDEHSFDVGREKVRDVIGDKIESDIPLGQIVQEAKERYHVYFVLPNMTQHYHDNGLLKYWVSLLGQQNVMRLEKPSEICQLIVGAVALCEENIGIEDLSVDIPGDYTKALIPLSKTGGAVGKYSAAGLSGAAGAGVKRL
jgi:hypothetical protein